ncbi:MAG: ParB/RepB/Spo0J family partition protein [Micromonosporaceae bacterium]
MSKFREPGNVREDLDLTPEFCASVAENGVRVPLLITTDGDGGFRVIEGHRRLAAAVKAGLAEVPYDLDGERAADEAGQYLDMVTANSAAYRKELHPAGGRWRCLPPMRPGSPAPGSARPPAASRIRSRPRWPRGACR